METEGCFLVSGLLEFFRVLQVLVWICWDVCFSYIFFLS